MTISKINNDIVLGDFPTVAPMTGTVTGENITVRTRLITTND